MTDLPVNTRPAWRAPPKVGSAIAAQVGRLAAASGAMDPALAQNWAEIVGPTLSPFCRPVRLKKRGKAQILVVAVPNGAAAMRVQYAQAEILTRTATFLKLPHLKTLAIEQSGSTRARAPDARWKSQAITQADVKPTIPQARQPAQSVAEALDRLRQSIMR